MLSPLQDRFLGSDDSAGWLDKFINILPGAGDKG
jgi:hypothetical protein